MLLINLSSLIQGILQPDMWNVTPSNKWDWSALREMISAHGVRNSLLVAPMPTASTSQILGNNECFEPYTSNMYSRRVLRWAFCASLALMVVVVSSIYSYRILSSPLLTAVNLLSSTNIFWMTWLTWEFGHLIWRTPSYITMVLYRGFLKYPIHWKQSTGMFEGWMLFFASIPSLIGWTEEIFCVIVVVASRTVWEIKQRTIVDMAADRGAYIDQSQSLNIHMDQPNFGKLTSLHFYTWSKVKQKSTWMFSVLDSTQNFFLGYAKKSEN